jgi:hypothetical protein
MVVVVVGAVAEMEDEGEVAAEEEAVMEGKK